MCAQSCNNKSRKDQRNCPNYASHDSIKKSPTAQSPIPKTAQKVKLKIEGSKDSEKKIPIPTAMKTGIQ